MQSANQQRRSFIGRIVASFGIGSSLSLLRGGETWKEKYERVNAPDVGHGVIGEQAQDGPVMALDYIGSHLLPPPMRNYQSPMNMAHDLVFGVTAMRDESERREIALAGVSAVAHGATGALNTAHPNDWAWHPAYQDTLDLRRKFEAAMRMLSERIPSGQQIVLYPCGCSALGNPPDGEFLPLKCGTEGHEQGEASIVRGLPRGPRPTIEELEAILAQDGNGPSVTILPNGQVTA